MALGVMTALHVIWLCFRQGKWGAHPLLRTCSAMLPVFASVEESAWAAGTSGPALAASRSHSEGLSSACAQGFGETMLRHLPDRTRWDFVFLPFKF